MTRKERVAAAMRFEKADRVPRYDIFLPEFAEKWHEAKNVPYEKDKCEYDYTIPVLQGGSINPDSYFQVFDYYKNIDIGAVGHDQEGPYLSKAGIERREGSAYYERDSWGRLLYKKDNAYFNREIEAIVKVKGKEPEFDFPEAQRRRELLSWVDDKKHERFCMVSGVLGLFMGCQHLRGEVQFLMDLAEDEPYCIYLVNKLADYIIRTGIFAAENTKTKDTAFWVYDELASRTGPMFSPKTYERVFFPVYKRMIDTWRKAGLSNIILHSDGNNLQLLDLIIESGFTGHQSPAPTAGMWLPDLKKRFGNKLVWVGGMCNIRTLANGTKKEIENEAAAILEAAKDGGVIIGTHSIGDDIPVGNYDIYDSYLNKYNNGTGM